MTVAVKLEAASSTSVPFPKTHNNYKHILHRYFMSIEDVLVNTKGLDAYSAVRAASALPTKRERAPNVNNGSIN